MSELYQELRKLCRGRALLTPDLDRVMGPALAELAGDGGRRALAALLTERTQSLPDDLRQAAQVALALHPHAHQRFLSERLDWLAADSRRDIRTVRRRVEEALSLLAELIGTARPAARPAPAGEWHPELIRTLVRLDTPAMEVWEERTIVVTAGEVAVATVAVSLPPPPGGTAERDLDAEVLYGARLVGRDRPSESHFQFSLGLPRPLYEGDRHTWGMRFTLPADQPMAPHYALTPFTHCDACDIRIRFSALCPPRRVWLLDGVPPRVIDDAPDGLPQVELDGVGEAHRHFERLTPGVGYGFRWSR